MATSQDDSAAPTLSWTIASLASGASVDLTFSATVLAPTGAPGEYLNVAEVTAVDQFDPDSTPGNDDGDQSEDDEDNATVAPQVADLSLTKSVDDSSPNVGDSVTFTVTVTNAGPDTATTISVTDVLPAGYSYAAGSIAGGSSQDDSAAPTLTWTVASLASGASVDLTFDATVLAPTGAPDEYLNVAEVTAVDQHDPDSTPDNDDGDQSEDDEDNATVTPQVADLSLAKTVDDAAPNVGDSVTFTITVFNAGPAPATNVSVTDVLPAGYSYDAGSIAGGSSQDDSAAPSLSWSIASLASGGFVDLTFTATVVAPTGAPGEYLNTAEITASDQHDPDSTPDNDDGDQSEDDEDNAAVTPQVADLSLAKAVDDATPNVGDSVTFTVTLTNDGPSTATNISVTDVLPAGYSYDAGSIAGGTSQDDSAAPTLSWTIASLASGASVDLTFTATVLAPTGAPGEYVNAAEVTAVDQFDPDSTPNNDDGDQSEDDEDNATVTPQTADLSLTKTVSDPTANVGDTVTFTITVTNAGLDTATNISVEDGLPAGYSYDAGSIAGGSSQDDSAAPTLTWTIASLSSGASSVLTFDATVLAPTGAPGEYVNVAEVTAVDQFDPDSTPDNDDGDQSEDDEDNASVTPQVADLSLTKTVDDATPNVDDSVTFTVTLTNAGPSTATNISVTDLLPAGYSYDAGSIAGGDTQDDSAAPTLTWTMASLASGASVNLTFDATVLAPTGAPGEYLNVAEVTAVDQFDPDSTPGNDDGDQSEDDEDNATVAPQVADLSLTKSVDDSSPNVGDSVTFTVTVTNAGPDTATTISVTDVLPAGYSYAAGSIAGGSSQDDSAAPTLTWTVASLASGASVDLTFDATVLAPTGAPDEYLNVAEVTAVDQHDPDSTPDNDDGDQSEDDEDNAVAVPQTADLSLTKTVDDATPNVGDSVTFTVTVTNAGPDTATSVSVTDVLPAGYSYDAGSIAGGSSQDDSAAPTLTWSIASLASGASVDLTFTATVLAPTGAPGEYMNTAEVTASDQHDPDSTPDNDDGDQSEDDEDNVSVTPQTADLSLTKTVDDATPNVGESVTFTITVTNAGPDTATNVTVEDSLPSGYTYDAASIAGGSSQDDSAAPTLTWSLASLASGASVDLTFTATVLAPTGAPGEYVNAAEVTAVDQFDPDSTPNNDDGDQSEDDEDNATVTPQVADLSLTKSVDDSSPNVGDSVTFTVTVTNAGPDTATNISVEDGLPAGYSYDAGSIAGGDSQDDSATPTLTWSIASLASGASVDLTFTATVLAPTGAPDEYLNVAEVTAVDQHDPDSTPGNDDGDQSEDDEDSATVTPQVADLSLLKNVSNSSPNVGDSVTFTVTVTNTGPDTATDVTVEDSLPAGYSYDAASIAGGDSRDDSLAPTLTWLITSLPSGASANLTFTATVLAPTGAPGEYMNVAEVTGAEQHDPDSTPDNDDGDQSEDDEDNATVTPQTADLSLTKTVDDVTANVGESVTFTITVTNAGPDTATNVTVEDSLPSGYTYDAASIAGGSSQDDSAAPTLTWTVASLASGASVDLTFTATVLAPTGAPGEYVNVAEVTASDQHDPDSTPGNDDGDQSEDDEDNASVTPEQADLSLTKTVDDAAANVGESVSFTVTVTNTGPDTATNVTVEDSLPSGYSYDAGSIAGGSSQNDSAAPTLSWSIASLASGTSVDLTFDATVLAPTGAPGEYLNTAEVTAVDQHDPDSVPDNDDGDQSEDDEDNAPVTPQVADLSLSKTVSNPTANVGDSVTFTISLINVGPDTATNVSVTDLLPAGYSYDAGSIAGGTSQDDSAAPTLTWSVASLGSGSSVDLTFTATVLAPTGAPGEYLNTAEVTASDQHDPDSTPDNDDGDQSEDDEDSATLTPDSADLSLAKTVDDATPNVGDSVTFTITVTNAGPDTATNVTVQDSLPAGYAYDVGSIAGGTSQDDSAAPTLSWSIASLVSGASVDLTFDATVLAPTGAPGEYLNVAEVTGAEQHDPDSSPNNDDGDQSEDDEDNAAVTPEQADLVLAKTVDDATPNVGDSVTFTVTVTNAGPDTATNISVTDLLPAGYSYGAGSIAGGDSRDDSLAPTLTWSVASLAATGTAVLTFDATVLAPTGAPGEYLNVAEVTASDQHDPDSTPDNDDGDQSEDDEDNASVTPQTADLSLTKAVDDATPNVGDSVTFTVTVTNDGPSTATNVSVTDVLPAGYSYDAGSIAGGGSQDDSAAPALTWSIASLASGASVDLTFSATVLAPTGAPGEYVNTAEVTASDQFDADSVPDNDDGDQSEDDEDNVSVTPQVADLSLAKSVDDATPNVGDSVSFTVTVTNDGPDTATNVTVTDVLPAGYSYAAGSIIGGTSQDDSAAPTLSWTIASLASGASVGLSFDATVLAPTGAPGEYLNAAEITAVDQYDPDSTPDNDDGDQSEDDEDNASVSPQVADLSLAKTVDDATPNVGESVTFTITVFNAGPSTATNISVEDGLPAGYSYDAGSIAGGSSQDDSAAPTLSWTVGSLASGGFVDLTFTATVLAPTGAPGEYVNAAEVTASDQHDPDSTPDNDDGDQSEDDEDNASVTPEQADLSLTKTVDDAAPNVGDSVTFTVTVTNDGPSTATNISVEDSLPSGYSYDAASIAGGSSRDDSAAPTLSWTVASVASGASVDLTFTATVLAPPGAPDEYLNAAEITAADQHDPDSVPDNDDGDQSEDDEDNASVTPQTADLSLTKTVDDATPNVGDSVSFTVTVTNAGPSTATNVTVEDSLPVGYSYDAGSIAGGSSQDDSAAPTLTWSIASLASGASVDLTFSATVLAPTGAPGEYVNTAEVTASDQFDPDSTPDNDDGDQSEDDEDNATVTPQTADLSLTKTVDDATPNVGESVTFTITVTNAGPDTATNVTVEDSLPSGYTYDAASIAGGSSRDDSAAPTLSWTVASVASGASVDLTFTATVLAPTGAPGEYLNVAEITASDQHDPDSVPDNDDGDQSEDDEDNAAATPQTADVSLSKTVSSAAPAIGETVTYTVSVTNSGPITATNIDVADQVPDGLGSIGNISNGGSLAGSTVTWTIPTLASGASIDLTFTATVVAPTGTPGEYVNVAEVTAMDQFDPDSTPNNDDGDQSEDDEDAQAIAPAVIGLAKAVANVDNDGGGSYTVTYTLTVENLGPELLTDLAINDDVVTQFAALTPSAFTAIDGTLTANPSWDGTAGSNVVASGQSLAPGEVGTVSISMSVVPGGDLGPHDNTATTTATTPSGSQVDDVSTDGIDPDADGDDTDGTVDDDGLPGEDVPTPVSFTEGPSVGTAKTVVAGPTSNGDGSYDVTYSLLVENTGDVALTGVQVQEDLSVTFASVVDWSVVSVTSTEFAVSSTFDGSSDIDLLLGTDALAVGEFGVIILDVVVTPGDDLGPHDNMVIASGLSPTGTTVVDSSQDGVDPDPDDDGNPTNNTEPTPVVFLAVGSVTGTVWFDLDGDGVIDAGEQDISGVRLVLSCAGPDGILDTGDDVVVGETVTASPYLFTDVPEGACRVDVDQSTLPSGVSPTYDLDGGLDSTAAVTVIAGSVTENVDFGYLEAFDVTLDKDISGDPRQNQALDFVLTVTNDGPGTAFGPIEVTDTVPSAFRVTGVSGPSGWNCGADGQFVTCNTTGDLAVGQTATITIGTTVVAPQGVQVANTASVVVTGPVDEPNTSNNSDTVTVTIGQLPRTGSDLGDFTRYGLILLVAGWLLLAAARRRDDERPADEPIG